MEPVFLETALNGPWSQQYQPLMPISVEALIDEGIACANIGASIIHLHVYDPATGRQFEDFEAYKTVIEGIRSKCDVIVYPTLPLAGSHDAKADYSAEERFAVVEKLAKADLLEWAVIDPGTTIIAGFDDIDAGSDGFIYKNSVAEIRYGLQLAARYQFHPSYAIYEAGFMRLGEALYRSVPDCPVPIYRFMFSDGFAFGFPPEPSFMESYCDLLEGMSSDPFWMVAGLRADIRPLYEACLQRGGHLRVGLEDAAFHSQLGNAALTQNAVDVINRSGRIVGTASQLRAQLASRSQ
jgi:uncharacterized protein (DUF849 family)